jgi:tagaturonate reductase
MVVTPIERDNYADWKAQDGLFHVLTKGLQQGKIVDEKYLVKGITKILHLYPEWQEFLKSAENTNIRYLVSNTTEAGIRFSAEDKFGDAPPTEFPAKLTCWLHRRYLHFGGSVDSGCIFLPVELILQNGTSLRNCILQYADSWGLGEGFKKWIFESNTFCNTLVDRIVPGVSRDALQSEWQKLGFEDIMVTQGEVFHFWAIEAPESVRKELPLDKIGLNIVFTDDLTPFRNRKVRILNGAHTAMVPVAYLAGIKTVRETLEHPLTGAYIRHLIFEEILPTLDLPEAALLQFASEVLDRFLNPFIVHPLLSISLNSVSKFKTRVLPSILDFHERRKALPTGLTLTLAALIRFYKGEYNGETIPLNDDQWALDFMKAAWVNYDGAPESLRKIVKQVLQWEDAWEMNLTNIPGLEELTGNLLIQIVNEGMDQTLKSILS